MSTSLPKGRSHGPHVGTDGVTPGVNCPLLGGQKGHLMPLSVCWESQKQAQLPGNWWSTGDTHSGLPASRGSKSWGHMSENAGVPRSPYSTEAVTTHPSSPPTGTPCLSGFVQHQLRFEKVSAALEKQEAGIFVDRKSELSGNPLLAPRASGQAAPRGGHGSPGGAPAPQKRSRGCAEASSPWPSAQVRAPAVPRASTV